MEAKNAKATNEIRFKGKAKNEEKLFTKVNVEVAAMKNCYSLLIPFSFCE